MNRKTVFQYGIIAIALIITVFLNAACAKKPTSDGKTTGKPILLSADVPGEYGKELTVNANTEHEILFYAFYLPEGTYQVTNRNSREECRVGVYSGIAHIGMWEELDAKGCDEPVTLQPGETKPLTVQAGQFVKPNYGATNIEFVRTGD